MYAPVIATVKSNAATELPELDACPPVGSTIVKSGTKDGLAVVSATRIIIVSPALAMNVYSSISSATEISAEISSLSCNSTA